MPGFSDESTKYAFGETNNYFFWIPWIMPHIGGPIGALVYMFMIGAYHPDAQVLAQNSADQNNDEFISGIEIELVLTINWDMIMQEQYDASTRH